MKDIIKNYGYLAPGSDNERYYITPGQLFSGHTVGIMVQDVHYPLIPGNVVNGYTYNYPVRFEVVPGANQARMHTGDPTLLPDLIATAKKLEHDGCRAVVGACGYFGHFQKGVADEVDIPVYLSSIVQIPWIRVGLRPHQKIGIIVADKENTTDHLFEACSISEQDHERCIIEGAGDKPEFSALLERRGHFDNGILRQELIDIAKKMVKDNRDIGAMLLECSDMPPYSAAIQREIKLPVYDFITMINFVHQAVAQRPYEGFM